MQTPGEGELAPSFNELREALRVARPLTPRAWLTVAHSREALRQLGLPNPAGVRPNSCGPAGDTCGGNLARIVKRQAFLAQSGGLVSGERRTMHDEKMPLILKSRDDLSR